MLGLWMEVGLLQGPVVRGRPPQGFLLRLAFWVPSPRAGPRHITEAPESAPPCASGVLCPGTGSGRLRSAIPERLLRPPGSALTQFLLFGPGSLSEEPLLLLLLPPAVPGALSPWGSAGSLCLTPLLLALLGMFPGHAI